MLALLLLACASEEPDTPSETGTAAALSWGDEAFPCEAETGPGADGYRAEVVLASEPLILQLWQCREGACQALSLPDSDGSGVYTVGCPSAEQTIRARWLDPR
jgi:hypothetical protein